MRRALLLGAATVALSLGVAWAASGGGLTEGLGAEPTSDADQESFAAISRAFTQRLNERFPPGSDAAALWAALEAEGFKDESGPDRRERVARLEGQGFLCDLVWIVTWDERMGVIERIEGLHDGICL